jgi:hypothetical protein
MRELDSRRIVTRVRSRAALVRRLRALLVAVHKVRPSSSADARGTELDGAHDRRAHGGARAATMTRPANGRRS